MTTFIVIAALMVAVVLVWLGVPLLRGRASGADVNQPAINLAIYRDQFAELEADRARGAVSEAQYAETRAELERRVIEEGSGGLAAPAPGAGKAGLWTAILLAGAVPVLAALMYLQWGEPDAFSPLGRATTAQGEDAHGGLSQAEMVEAVDRLAERLKKEPDNLDGWLTLARSYYSMGRFQDASAAFDHVISKAPNEADILADYADTLAMAQGRNLSGKPMELVQRALKADPTQWKALAMAGTDAFNRKDYRQAIDYWERLKTTLPPDAPIAQQIQGSINEARSLGGFAVPPPALAAAPKPAPSPVAPAAPAPATAGTAKATVSGTVDLSPALKAKASPDDAVFVFARPAEGSRMPVALTRAKVRDLPLRFTLDDSMAMSPDMVLSQQSKVIVGARISKAGVPMPQPGDLEGFSTAVAVGARDVKVAIDKAVP
ncbi:MAG TPA: c-type cytochrome biogenesis protein CcmI [Burkholderiaceae bacterium]|nr:c-type cytochrome biogenesis protein CcmI [Burkholderiaceae bacterium]HPE01994.1 c-type cytochrome biogenesis protein CcmI [Burkholderiaceae bacterium]HRZ02639.1 c-type cytochrome biogenesis protein CcmI [Burkholderiaceae bacterium]